MRTPSPPNRTAVEPILQTIEDTYRTLDEDEELDGELQHADARPSTTLLWEDGDATRYLQANVLEDDGYEVEVEWHVLQEYEENGEQRRQWDHYVADTVSINPVHIQNAVHQAYDEVINQQVENLEYDRAFRKPR